MTPDTIIDIGIRIYLKKLISTRLLFQASSGGGKSYGIRKLAEECVNHVQVIILDIEGEFETLREKFPFALVSKEGDIPLSIRFAETLAHKLLETNLSAIVDLSDMPAMDRSTFVKKFLSALINSPRGLWHPMILVIDEADTFAPEGKESESTRSVIDMVSRGRKRGFCAVLATQRIAKLNKNATADILNKIIGLTGQDIDQQRAGKELGFTSTEKITSLRKLKEGEFYGYGPAINYEVQKFKISKAKTTHPEPGYSKVKAVPTPLAIKKILTKLSDLPAQAEKELNSRQQLEAEISRLRKELKKPATAHVSAGNQSATVLSLQEKLREKTAYADSLKTQLDASKPLAKMLEKSIRDFSKISEIITQTGASIEAHISGGLAPILQTLQKSPQKADFSPNSGGSPFGRIAEAGGKQVKMGQNSGHSAQIAPPTQIRGYSDQSLKLTGSGDSRILKAAAIFYPNPVTKTRLACIAVLKASSGTFSNYLSQLKVNGFISGSGQQWACTSEGLDYVARNGGVPTLPDSMVSFWLGVLGAGSGPGRILSYLENKYPEPVSKEQVASDLGFSASSGTFSNYISKLYSNNLIVKLSGKITLSNELFNS